MEKSVFDPKHLALARRAAAEGTVLLKNEDGTLPLSKDAPVALFGRIQCETFKGGGGSADVWAVPVLPFADGIEEIGTVYAPLLKKYRAYAEANYDARRNKRFGIYTYSLKEVPLSDAEIGEAASACRTAIFFIGRFSGEKYDVKDAAGRYRIDGRELDLLKRVRAAFERVVLVFNLPGLFDLSFFREVSVDAVLHTFLPGMEAGHALADVLYGDVNPSGKLPDTWAETACDYPTNEGFASERIVYSEGLYMGYRYFDAFGKDVVYPFGFGLSYTEFSYKVASVCLEKSVATLSVRVRNIGKTSGRETVQCYLSVSGGAIARPVQILCGFEKTACLAPNAEETVAICVDLCDFTAYDEATAAYILERGDYILSVGKHSRDTAPALVVRVPETKTVRQVENRLVPKEEISLYCPETAVTVSIPTETPTATLDLSAIETEIAPKFVPATLCHTDSPCTFAEVAAGKRTPEELVACLSDDELARLMTGDGPKKRQQAGLPDCELADGEGSHSHPVTALGIPASTMQDGPVGVRASGFADPVKPFDELNGTDCIAYPCSTLVAATWDRNLAREIGHAIVSDLERMDYDGWCAPAVNLHRNPLCGRNFEYFSEDPFLSAEMAICEVEGIQENPDGTPTGRYAILKHFAFNESEEYRKTSDSILTERTARELYLRAFEYVIRKKTPYSMMTAYNLVNGEYASASHGLIDGICRTEWGYDGWIMTDWNVNATVAQCIAGGADIVMPGEYVTMEQMNAEGVDRATAERRAVWLIRHLLRTVHHDV